MSKRTREKALALLRQNAGFDPHPDYIESAALCRRIISTVDEPLTRQLIAAYTREFLATVLLGGCQ